MKDIIKTVLIFLIATFGVSQKCDELLRSTKKNPVMKMYTGSMSFQGPQSGQNPSKRYIYQMSETQQPLMGDYQIALSIIYIQNYKTSQGMDFAVRPIKKTFYFQVVLIISQQARWSKAHIHYLVTQRDDFRAGFFIASSGDLLDIQPGRGSFNTSIVHGFGNKKWNRQVGIRRIRAIPYISGLKTDDDELDIRVYRNTSFNILYDEVSFIVEIAKADNPIENLYISYILFTENGALFVQSYPINQQILTDRVQSNPSLKAQFFGISGINGRNFRSTFTHRDNNNRRLTQQISSNINRNQIGLFLNSFNIQNIEVQEGILEVRGGLPANINLQLQNNFNLPSCVNFTICTEQNGFYVHDQQKGTEECVICKENQQYNYQLNKCQCKPKYILAGQQCIKEELFCRQKNFIIEGQCYQCTRLVVQCPQNKGYIWNETQRACTCNATKGQEAVQNRQGQEFCLDKCPEGTIRSFDLSCVCRDSNFYMNEQGKCVSCGRFAEFDYNQGKCRCRRGTQRNTDGSCAVCSPTAIYDQQKRQCICEKGYSGSGIICYKERQTTVTPSNFLSFAFNFNP